MWWSRETAHTSPAAALRPHRLSEITVAEVDRYRQAKVAEERLSPVSINKTLTRLGQILEVAVERELIPRNPANVGGKRRRLKAPKPARKYLDRAEQVRALLDAAGHVPVGDVASVRGSATRRKASSVRRRRESGAWWASC
jgi:hypothetical protein